MNQYKSLRSQEKQVRKDAAGLQKQGIQVLDRIRYALISQIAREQIDAVLQAYNLDRRVANRREDVLHGLRSAKDAVNRENEESKKPSAELQTELMNIYNGLNTKIDETQTVRAGLEETRRKMQEAMLANTELRERILAYLISILPGRRRDPKLMDYGLRESFKTRGRGVTVVEEEESKTKPETVPEPIQP